MGPAAQLGDLWALGAHRVVCGDATDPIMVGLALDGARPNLMVTDPPYGVGYDPAWRQQFGGDGALGAVANDNQADWREAWTLFPGDVAYVWHGSLYGRPGPRRARRGRVRGASADHLAQDAFRDLARCVSLDARALLVRSPQGPACRLDRRPQAALRLGHRQCHRLAHDRRRPHRPRDPEAARMHAAADGQPRQGGRSRLRPVSSDRARPSSRPRSSGASASASS